MASDLQQILCALNWMRTTIRSYAAISAQLHELLGKFCSQVGGRTSKTLGKLSLFQLWEPTHSTILEQTKLAYPNPDTVICIYTDASDVHWSGVLTQVSKLGRHLPLEEQLHEPLGSISGSFNSTSM